MAPMRMRNVCCTWNNYPADYEAKLKKMNTTYLCYGKEVGEAGTRHLQIYWENASPRTISAMQKDLGAKLHMEPRKGTAKEAAGYCMKGTKLKPEGGYGVYFDKPSDDWDGDQWGELSSQGERVDLNAEAESIRSGEKTVDAILEENPMAYHQYGRTLEKLEDLQRRKKFRTEMTKGIWYVGPTGVGKSHKAFEGFDPSTHYLVNLGDKGWYEGYTGQDTVILNDFRGEIPYNTLLQMVDKWPFTVPRRNREPMPFISKTVIVTSSLSPSEVYHRRDGQDKIEQLLRRFDVTELSVEGLVLPPGHFCADTSVQFSVSLRTK